MLASEGVGEANEKIDVGGKIAVGATRVNCGRFVACVVGVDGGVRTIPTAVASVDVSVGTSVCWICSSGELVKLHDAKINASMLKIRMPATLRYISLVLWCIDLKRPL
jgi:hypothetical protein